jgi:RNA polymerase sigma factor (sigma-70 family)
MLSHFRQLVAPAADRLADRELLQHYLGGRDETAFQALLKRHGPMVFGVCQAILHHQQDAEDAFQATFLVLARNAHSIRRQDGLASWLHGVAYRVARKALVRCRRRQANLAKAVPAAAAVPADDLSWGEVKAILHAELAALPEQFRTPIVLCHLEGLTQDQAASRLSCPTATIKGRLQRGRDLLGKRLKRRGLGAAALGAVTLTTQAIAAPLSGRLVASTLPVFAGADDSVSAIVATLARGVTRPALPIKLVMAVFCLVVSLAVAGGISQFAHEPVDRQATPPQAEAKAALSTSGPRLDRYGDPLPDGVQSRLGTIRFRPGLGANSLAFSPNGLVLASSTAEGFSTCLWDVKTGKPLHRRIVPDYSRSVAFTPDGKMLATTTGLDVALIDVATGKEIRRLEGNGPQFRCVAFAPDGKTVAASQGATVFLWNLADGKRVGTFADHPEGVLAIAFSPDGKTLACVSSDTVFLRQVASGEVSSTLKANQTTIDSATFLPSGKSLAAVDADGLIRWWEVETGKAMQQFQGDKYPVMTVSADGKLLATAGVSGTIRLLDAITAKEVRHWQAHPGGVSALAFSQDGTRLASAGNADHIRLWEVKSGKEVFPTPDHDGNVRFVRFSRDGRTLLSHDHFKMLEWDVATGTPQGRFGGEVIRSNGGKLAAQIAVSPDGKVAAWIEWIHHSEPNFDPTIHVCDVATGKELHALHGHSDWVSGVRFSPDGKTLASCGREGIRLWDAATTKNLQVIKEPQADAPAPVFSPDGRLLAFSGQSGAIVLWDLAQGKESHRWDSGHALEFAAILFSPDGQMIASHSYSEVRIWHTASGKQLKRFAPGNFIETIAISPSGRVVAISQRQRTERWQATYPITLWEVYSGQEIRQIDGPQGWAWALDFSPDGKLLATGGNDSTILLWDLQQLSTGQKATRTPLGRDELNKLWSDLKRRRG